MYIAGRTAPGNHIQFISPIIPNELSTLDPVIKIVKKSKTSPVYTRAAKT